MQTPPARGRQQPPRDVTATPLCRRDRRARQAGLPESTAIRALIFAACAALCAASPALADRLVEPTLHIATAGTGGAQVALTFDACSGAVDHRILDELIADQVPATIFVTGRWLRGNAEAFRLMLAHPDLFEIEDHGENHVPAVFGAQRPYGLKPAGTVAAVTSEVLGGRADIAQAGGGQAQWYRDATALYSPDALKLIERLGLRVAGFSLNGDIGASVSARVAAARIETAKDGDVVIAHINQPRRPAGAGVAEAIHTLKTRGYRFVRLADVAEIGG